MKSFFFNPLLPFILVLILNLKAQSVFVQW